MWVFWQNVFQKWKYIFSYHKTASGLHASSTGNQSQTPSILLKYFSGKIPSYLLNLYLLFKIKVSNYFESVVIAKIRLYTYAIAMAGHFSFRWFGKSDSRFVICELVKNLWSNKTPAISIAQGDGLGALRWPRKVG